MKVSDLIKILTYYLETWGDCEIVFNKGSVIYYACLQSSHGDPKVHLSESPIKV